jgi:hypothetical protein
MLSMMSNDQLYAELERRRQLADVRRAELLAELESLDMMMGGPGIARTAAPRRRGPGRPPGSKNRARAGRPKGQRGRPRGSGGGKSLVQSLHGVLRGKTMGVAEVSDAVQAAGYKTASANFRTIVNQALINNPDKFRKVSRGQYTSK